MILDPNAAPQTLDLDVGPLVQAQQMSRGVADKVPVPTTELRYKQNQYLSVIHQSENPKVIPSPKQVVS